MAIDMPAEGNAPRGGKYNQEGSSVKSSNKEDSMKKAMAAKDQAPDECDLKYERMEKLGEGNTRHIGSLLGVIFYIRSCI